MEVVFSLSLHLLAAIGAHLNLIRWSVVLRPSDLGCSLLGNISPKKS
jgi:hypothetical protein